jgi:hypothetical protein
MTPHDDLRAAAVRATPGPWEWRRFGLYRKHYDCRREQMVLSSHDVPLAGLREDDAAFIALAHPARILALLDDVERLGRERDEARAERDDARSTAALAVRCHLSPDDQVRARGFRETLARVEGWGM